jgi:hypothetical protein
VGGAAAKREEAAVERGAARGKGESVGGGWRRWGESSVSPHNNSSTHTNEPLCPQIENLRVKEVGAIAEARVQEVRVARLKLQFAPPAPPHKPGQYTHSHLCPQLENLRVKKVGAIAEATTQELRNSPLSLTPLANDLHVPLGIRQSGLFVEDFFDLQCIWTGF